MSIYLHDIPLSQAKKIFREALQQAGLWRVLRSEIIQLDENAPRRVLVEPVWALRSSPHYHASAMDGFAVRAEATSGAIPANPVDFDLPTAAQYVDTGDPLPAWANAVIPLENVESLLAAGGLAKDPRSPERIRIRAAVTPWSHVRPLGEDIVATQLVLPAGHIIRPYDLGAIAASGHVTVKVAEPPKVAILPTGSELVPLGADLQPGDILEYNSLVLAAQLKEMGATPTRYPITRDNLDEICARVSTAAQTHDLILLNAGSSAGTKDYASRVVERLGKLLVHGVAVRPGHPVILGLIERQDKALIPIIGVPGYPVSAALTVDIFVEEIIARWLGRHPLEMPLETVTITRRVTSSPGDDDFMRVAIGRVGEKTLAAPIARGAGVITSLVRADGLVIVPSGVQGLDAGERVQARLYRSRAEIDRTIFCIGSHDVILDVLAQFLADHERRLVSANVGSQGGLVALKRGEAHLAGSHLLDPETGNYNVRHIRQYLPGTAVRLVGLMKREQGLIVQRGNPKGIHSLTELARNEVSFINRQRGAGTRVLLDYHLDKLGIATAQIHGYADEEYTHLGVAAAIASGRVDCGLGIPAAAQALELDFVPLYQERYDLVILKQYAESDLLSPLFDVLKSQSFQNAVKALPGYDVSIMGNVFLEE